MRLALAAALELTGADVDTRSVGSEVPDLRAGLRLPRERPLCVVRLDDQIAAVEAVADDADDLDLTDLLDHGGIDLTLLADAVTSSQSRRGGDASLGEVVADHPLEGGLTELVGYLQVADGDAVDAEGTEQVDWLDPRGTTRRATVPRVVFPVAVTSSAGRHEGTP